MRAHATLGALIVASLTAVAALGGVARADDTFEQKAAEATPVARLDDLVWVATAACDQGDDVAQRQCRHLRDARAKELAGKPIAIRAGAYAIGEWSAAKKSAEQQLSGCLACGDGIVVDGKRYWLVAGPPRAGDGAKPILATAQQFATAAARDQAAARASQAKVDLVVTLPEKARWELAGKTGITVDVVAYRVSVPCDGEVLAASPKAAAKGPVDPKSCPVKK